MIRSLRNKIDNEAVNEDAKISHKIRDMEFYAVYQYGNPEIKPIEDKDAVGVFKMTQYINAIERNLTDLSVDLDNEVNKVVAKIASSPEQLINNPIDIPVARPVRTNKVGVFGSGINDMNTITRLVSDWNAFCNYLTAFKRNMSQKDFTELHDELDNLVPSIEKNINNILIIDANEKNNRYSYEKRVLETIEERILSKNLSKITLREMDKGSEELQDDVRKLTDLADDISISRQRHQDDLDDINLSIAPEREALQQEIEALKTAIETWQQQEKANRNLSRVPPKTKHPNYPTLKDKEKELADLEEEARNAKVSAPFHKQEEEFEAVRKKLMKGKGQPLRPAFHFNDELNDLHKFYSV